MSLDGCYGVTGTIDEVGGIHLAATCNDGAVGYASSPDGATWNSTIIPPPANRLDSDAQVAFSGNTLYFAWTRQVQLDGGCGDSGIRDVGVNIRTRTLPDGAWSVSRRIGEAKDHLESIRVTGSTIHAAVRNETDGKTWYETISGDEVHRTLIPGAGDTALRIGNDGVARIAYAHAGGIRFGTVDRDGVRAATIPGSAHGSAPVFALAPDGSASIFWTRYEYGGGGCAEPDPPSTDGMYFATNAGGGWDAHQVSHTIGGASVTIDPVNGEIHAVLVTERGLDYLHRPGAGGPWVKKALAIGNDEWTASPVIRQDLVSGRLYVFFVRSGFEDDSTVEAMHLG